MSFKSVIRYIGRVAALAFVLFFLALAIGTSFLALQTAFLVEFHPPFSLNGWLLEALLGGVLLHSPGCIAAVALTILLTSQAGKRADVCLFVSALFSYLVFKGWYEIVFTKIENYSDPIFAPVALSPILAALGFGLGSFVLALTLPQSALSISEDSERLVRQRKLSSLRIAMPILLVLAILVAAYFYEYPPRPH
jgi:hypothetical protein